VDAGTTLKTTGISSRCRKLTGAVHIFHLICIVVIRVAAANRSKIKTGRRKKSGKRTYIAFEFGLIYNEEYT